MTKENLVSKIYAKGGAVQRRDIAKIVDRLFEVMALELAKGERIELRGFGVFTVESRAARQARNPATGAAVTIPARKVVKFVASSLLNEAMK